MGFLELRHQCRFSQEVRRGSQGASGVDPGSQISMRVVRWSASLLSSHGRGNRAKDMLKDSRGLSGVMAGNPGFRRLVPVTSGSFSRCL